MSDRIHVECPPFLAYLQPIVFDELVRVGNFADGGYALTSTALQETTKLLSLGLGENWSFEESVANLRPNLSIDVYDHTVSQIHFLAKALKGLAKFLLFCESSSNVTARISRLVGYRRFWAKSIFHKHKRVEITHESFRSILKTIAPDANIGLKVDIEGSEWEILNSITECKERFIFVILEIHEFDSHANLLEEFIKKMSEIFLVAHLHANNFAGIGENGFPTVFELTLLRKKEGQDVPNFRSSLPIAGLDSPNARNRPDYSITF